MKYLLPISYLAPIEYYAFLLQKENIFIESKEHFVKQSIRNRCNIYGSNGMQTISIPKKRKSSSKTLISDIYISKNHNWQKEHYNAIESAYNSSPFFQYYKDGLKKFYNKKQENLFDFNFGLTKKILEFLQLEKEIKITSKYVRGVEGCDLRDYDFISSEIKEYSQVFEEKHGFIPNLSILDLLCNIGPESTEYLEKLSI